MSRSNKNILQNKSNIIGPDIRENYYKEVLRNGAPFPTSPLLYEDIDKEFERWVSEDLEIVNDGKKLDTFVLYSNQRFSEFMQTWGNTDNNKNILLHFKTITRDKNPNGGTIVGDVKNIPGNRWYTLKKVKVTDKSGNSSFISYKIRQPFAVDLVYKVSIITNKIEVINQFNMIINDKFKAKQCYIRPNGHYVPMELENISDESENDIKDRQYMSQTYTIKVLGYIIREEDMEIFEEPVLRLSVEADGVQEKPVSEIEEYENGCVKIVSRFKNDYSRTRFHSDSNVSVTSMSVSNISSFRIFVGGTEIQAIIRGDDVYSKIEYDELGNITKKESMSFKLFEGDEITYKSVVLKNKKNVGCINIIGNKF